MAALRYFKKLTPSNDVILPGNIRIKFTTLDGLVGWLAHDNESVQQGLEQCIREQRYGLTEVSAQEYVAGYLEKKNQPSEIVSGKLWREEFGKGASSSRSPITQLGSQHVAAAVGLNSPDVGVKTAPVGESVPVTEPEPSKEKKKEPFNPPIGKRPKKVVAKTEDLSGS